MVDNKPIERVIQYRYLGCTIKEKLDDDVEIRIRIGMATSALVKSVNTYVVDKRR